MIRIQNGRVYDPVNGWNGDVRDVYYEDGVIAAPPQGTQEIETFGAGGCAVLAGGIDPHAHIAGEPLALLRDAGDPAVPSDWTLGREYANMGYTLAVNAAAPALAARHTLAEENAIPLLDTANLIWVGENPALLELAKNGSDEELDQYVSWLLAVSGGWGLKLINPREGETDGELPYAQLIERLLAANERLNMPHALHLHHPYLGRADAYTSVTETMARAEGRRLHLAHLQFYGYRRDAEGRTYSAAESLAKALGEHPNVTCDVGAVVFGHAAAVTADAAFARKLGRGKAGFRSALWELDGAFGVLPLTYAAKSQVGSAQFLIGLELLLLAERPEQIFLTTDHPNGGPFTAYPYLIRLLMDKSFRDEEIQKLNAKAVSLSAVPSIKREYSLYEIAQITRSGPARALGMKTRGHLGVGAAGGVAVYREQADKQKMFSEPVRVFRGETNVLAARERPFDAAWLEKKVAPVLSVPFGGAYPGGTFFAEHRVTREEA